MKQIIYVVDDDLNISKLLRLYLEQEGFEVQHFARGDEALAAFRQTEPALMLLDIMLPEEDGLSIIKRLRARAMT